MIKIYCYNILHKDGNLFYPDRTIREIEQEFESDFVKGLMGGKNINVLFLPNDEGIVLVSLNKDSLEAAVTGIWIHSRMQNFEEYKEEFNHKTVKVSEK